MGSQSLYQLHTLILLSLGSLLPLSTYFALPPDCHLHIIDSHRPWNLQNLFGLDFAVNDEGEAMGTGRVWVWGDGEEGSLGNIKKSWEALEYEASESGSDDGDSGEDDDDEDQRDDDEDQEDDVDDEEEGDSEREGSESGGESSRSQLGGRKGKRRRDSSEGTKKKPRREADPAKVSSAKHMPYNKLTIATASPSSCPRGPFRASPAILRIRHIGRYVRRSNALRAGNSPGKSG